MVKINRISNVEEREMREEENIRVSGSIGTIKDSAYRSLHKLNGALTIKKDND